MLSRHLLHPVIGSDPSSAGTVATERGASVQSQNARSDENAAPVATEHRTRIVFCNIDWKRSRHISNKATIRNLQQLEETIHSIVRNCSPSVLALCEVGETGQGMAEIQMHEIVDAICATW